MGFDTTRGVLASPLYVGRPENGDDDVLARPAGRWPALIDDETWATVRARVASHSRIPRQASGRYLLTGFMRCPRCGCRMVGKVPGIKPPIYYCFGRRRGAAAPDPDCYTCVPARTLDSLALGLVANLLAVAATNDPTQQDLLRSAWAALSRPTDDGSRRRAQELERTIAEAKTRLARAAGMLVDGTIDKLGYEALRDQVLADVEAANAELSRLRGREPSAVLPDLDEVLRAVDSWGNVLAAADVAAQRDVLAALVETITPRRVRRGRYEPEVVWTPLGASLRALADAVGGNNRS